MDLFCYIRVFVHFLFCIVDFILPSSKTVILMYYNVNKWQCFDDFTESSILGNRL